MSARDSRRRSRLSEAGYAAILTALLAATLLIPLTAFAVDVARWYTELERVQTAADAAATAGVTYMPDDFANAKATAIAVSAKNGYPNATDTKVYVEATSKPSQLQVTVTSKIPNGFGSIFGKPYTTVSRSATADFNGPAPMGSPCNSYGNEPLAAVNVGNASSTGSANNRGPRSPASVIVAPTGGASCTSNPQYWAAIAAPDTPKGNGDAFMTRTCGSGNSGCSGTTNSEFDPMGYIYIVRVKPEAIGVPFTLQLYDPAFVEVGDACEHGPTQTTGTGNTFQANMSPYTPLDGTNSGTGRYTSGNATTFCNGDVLGGGSAADIITSYGLRQPTDTYQPKLATPITSCQKQYPGYDRTMTQSQRLRSGNANYNENVARVFRQWVDLCTYTPTQSGDFYLQIRTNVALGGTSDGQGGYSGNATVFSQNGDNTAVHGSGNNRFAMRIKGSQRANISISGFQAMGMYANYAGASTTFNLVRVVPAAATKTLKVGFFDTGDASQPGTLTVQPPTDSNMPASIGTCTGSGVVNGSIPGCQLTNVSSATYNGRWQYVNVPIPANYTCSVNLQGGCWFTLRFSFPNGVPNDTTTWTAKIDGDPVRLIK